MITAIICTRADNGTHTRNNLLEFFNSCHIKTQLMINQTSIFNAYTQAIQVSPKENNDFFIFCHDDIEILCSKDSFLDVLNNYLSNPKIGFIGPAGTTHLDRECVWWNQQLWQQGKHKGLVFHGESLLKAQPTYYGPYGKVIVLDGLFLACNGKIINSIKTEKPKEFPGEWDFYDLYYTTQAYLNGYNNYAVPIPILHNSRGELAGRDSWHANRLAYRQLFNKHLPLSL